jgi:hypothetical protein
LTVGASRTVSLNIAIRTNRGSGNILEAIQLFYSDDQGSHDVQLKVSGRIADPLDQKKPLRNPGSER